MHSTYARLTISMHGSVDQTNLPFESLQRLPRVKEKVGDPFYLIVSFYSTFNFRSRKHHWGLHEIKEKQKSSKTVLKQQIRLKVLLSMCTEKINTSCLMPLSSMT